MDTPALTQPASREPKGLIRKIKYALALSAIFGLLSTNIATLASDTAHTSLFDGLKHALSYIFADTVADNLLSLSPTTARSTDVAKKSTRQTAEIQRLQNVVSSVENSNKKLLADKTDLANRYQKLATDHDDLDAKHKKLKVDHDDLNARHTKITNDHQHMIKTNGVRQDKLRAISSRMTPRLGGIATKSIATLPGRMAPYLGAAASVAFTAWELAELCNLMNDLDELNITFGNAFQDPTKVCGLPRPSIFDFY